MRRIRHLLISIVVGALAAVPALAQDSALEVGMRAPAFTLDDTKGNAVNLASVIGTKPVVLEFWAFWCENCKQLEPRLFAAHAKYSKEVAFYGVAVSINQTPARVARYVEQYRYPFPMLWDKEGKAAELYDVPATSYVVVIDRSGKVVYTGAGGSQDLDAAIRKAL
jgi:peroxiredoxin